MRWPLGIFNGGQLNDSACERRQSPLWTAAPDAHSAARTPGASSGQAVCLMLAASPACTASLKLQHMLEDANCLFNRDCTAMNLGSSVQM